MGGCQVDGLFAQLFYTFRKRHTARLTLLDDPVNGVESFTSLKATSHDDLRYPVTTESVWRIGSVG
jgi:hypothetical protein